MKKIPENYYFYIYIEREFLFFSCVLIEWYSMMTQKVLNGTESKLPSQLESPFSRKVENYLWVSVFFFFIMYSQTSSIVDTSWCRHNINPENISGIYFFIEYGMTSVF